MLYLERLYRLCPDFIIVKHNKWHMVYALGGLFVCLQKQ